MGIADLRREYSRSALIEDPGMGNPLDLFAKWFAEALAADVLDANAMTLSTLSTGGAPRSRIVLLKGAEPDGFRFYTNYESPKGRELAADGRASLVFYWSEVERQVRVEGQVERLPEDESDSYFAVRPRDSQLGAWASPQSNTLPDRASLEQHLADVRERFGSDGQIPRPPHWGGYLLRPTALEFWQGREARLHDRLRFEADGESWKRERLAP